MNETLRTIYDLESTHGNFIEKKVPKEDVETILKASVRAANAGNAQNYSIVISEDLELMRQVCGFDASHILVYCIDTQRNTDLAQYLGLEYTADPAWMLLTGATDVALAAQTAVIAARSLGVDSLISNGVQRGNVRRFWRLLDLPEKNCIPILGLYLGYAESKINDKKGRLFEPGVIHREKYQHRTAEVMDTIIEKTDTTGYSAPVFSNWRDNYDHYLEMFFKGPGGRASTMYGNISTALSESGIIVKNTEE